MDWHGWLGLKPKPESQERGRFACVLSGGGSRASFQLGALEYLYAHDEQFEPDTFVGASAGSIIAATLAQADDREGQHEALSKLTTLWLSVTEMEEMFIPRPWLAQLQASGPAWLQLMGNRADKAASKPLRKLPFAKAEEKPEETAPPATKDPVAQALTPDEDFHSDWSLDLLGQLAGNLSILTRIGPDLAAVREGVTKARSLYRQGPFLNQLLDLETFDARRILEAKTTLRMAMVALESGELRFMREDGSLADRNDKLVETGPYDLVHGVLASCAIPGVFLPVAIGDLTYVDGGARENIPAEMAIGHLDADLTYVISSQCVGVPRRESMRDSDIFNVVMRSTEILMDEAARDELAYAISAGAKVCYPELDVHDAMMVDPAKIRINIDYGRLRAAELHLDLDQETVALHRDIVATRMTGLELEDKWRREPDSGKALAALREAKLKELPRGSVQVAQRPRSARSD